MEKAKTKGTASEKNALYCLIYRAKKQGVRVSLKEKTIYYNCTMPDIVKTKTIQRLCKIYGFGRQAVIE